MTLSPEVKKTHPITENGDLDGSREVINILFTSGNHYVIPVDIEDMMLNDERQGRARIDNIIAVEGDGRCCFVSFLRQLKVNHYTSQAKILSPAPNKKNHIEN